MIVWLKLERTLQVPELQLPDHGLGWQPPDQAAQGSI